MTIDQRCNVWVAEITHSWSSYSYTTVRPQTKAAIIKRRKEEGIKKTSNFARGDYSFTWTSPGTASEGTSYEAPRKKKRFQGRSTSKSNNVCLISGSLNIKNPWSFLVSKQNERLWVINHKWLLCDYTENRGDVSLQQKHKHKKKKTLKTNESCTFCHQLCLTLSPHAACLLKSPP